MRFTTLGDKRNFVGVNVRNAEASATISAGVVTILNINATDDGLAVILPISSTAAKIGAFQYGIATRDIIAGKIGEVLCQGIFDATAIVHATRAASTDSYASYASQAAGAVLHAVSNANALSVIGASTASWGQAFYLAQSFASGASSASTTAATGTVVTSARKVFCRLM